MTPTPFVDKNGNYLGIFTSPPIGGVAVPEAPDDARQVWTGKAYGPVPDKPQEEQDWEVLADAETQAEILVELYKNLVKEGGTIQPDAIDTTAAAKFEKLKTAVDRKEAR
ncbi:MAG: hypothetical protein CMN56_05230 [Sneathiella sp.]|uniref:hypothetical protein n=1 Tax=Sneathiella sp. TaxID=1964365 RepID=UPI000C5DD3A5|nr:hypothetical protein [Sneathiella sp.]MAZ02522.1 hypothetical protein [Sneathiella sp.]